MWIDFSSIDKATIVAASDELSKKGWTVVDASAGGVEEVAAAGQLALWVSGSKALFDEYQPVFKPMAQVDPLRRRTGQRQDGEERDGDARRRPAHERWSRSARG